MPRSGLDATAVVAAAAALADEVGFPALTMNLLAERVGVRPPSLYNHVAGQDDLVRRVAALALTEAADAVDAAIRGRAGTDALSAAAHAFRAYVRAHPGRYAATLGAEPLDPGDPVSGASAPLVDSFTAVLHAYPLAPDEVDHALRAVRSLFHGFATLEVAHGFQWPVHVDDSFDWLVALVDRGLRSAR